ncbi:MAG: glycosyl transferase [Candidatus Nealsonbacteria bacterium CG_4_10_14_0_2_um_filter_38_17]|uniref:Glycosyl transferase n=2 Tax=Candidatus Nealsoniibacteriota TaxID=1817911 RepID=A0A2M7UXE1_9BACT|nr:MAG: glycosyl transferase [Candidatus Nealsonbacteria bacterium CG23_combo_of_CG06-09_8_20_14_all_38_19]PIZ88535.1 MAG: glycosyl transferase [Candidatus Nealsonbacteria bacterium CG_4_10_14_0_2_um_filter_38_17]
MVVHIWLRVSNRGKRNMRNSPTVSNGVKRKLKIAIFCTNEWPTPPPQNTFYAPLWMAFYIAEGLAKRGHKVFYFGSRESKLKYAKLVSFGMPAIKYNKKLSPFIPQINEKVANFYEQLMVSKIYQMDKKEKFDIIHIHPYRRCINFAPLTKTPTVITIHDPINGFIKHMLSWTKNIPQIFLVSLSNAQRKPLLKLNYIATVYNGIDLKKFKFNEKPKDYFVAAGRFVPEKGIDLAILAAKKAKIKLRIAGGPAKGIFWEKKIKPYLDKNIKYVGMIDYLKMSDFYRKAKGLLYPHRWQEPFGLIFVESMACGTPPIAFDRGSAKEIIKDGKTGFIVKNFDEMVRAIKRIDEIHRENCRSWVEEKFSVSRMVDDYEKVYHKILSR